MQLDFINILLDLAVQSITKRWIDIEKNTCIPFEEFISTIKFILSSTYFVFNDTFYKQIFGTSMDSPLSPIITNTARSRGRSVDYHWSCPFIRYVDNTIVLAVPIDKATHILNTFNSFHERLQFTIEYKKDYTLSFLNLLLSVKNDRILIDWSIIKKPLTEDICHISLT